MPLPRQPKLIELLPRRRGGAKRYPSIAVATMMGFAKAQPILRALAWLSIIVNFPTTLAN
jgi:hypothetical protein